MRPCSLMRRAVALLGACAAATAADVDARLVASIEATLALYPAVPESAEAVARYLGGVLWRPATSVLVYEGRLFADARFLAAEKHRKHANFMASVLHHERVPNVGYAFSGNSTGECPADVGVAPCWVIAKTRGYGQRGVLVPNPSPRAAASQRPAPLAGRSSAPGAPPGTFRTSATGRRCGATCARARRRGRSVAGTRARSGGATSPAGCTRRPRRPRAASARRARTSLGTTRAWRR